MQEEKTTCLSPTKTTLMFFRSCSLILLIFKTSEQQLDLVLEANIWNNTCKATNKNNQEQYTNQENA
jgi:hypothetical protein